ncbi:hypothetical protein [Nostoc sp. 'Peltigera malacea cyanobiont' DB3992]|uniref:hypothetical protein n=1 Tax=Nostoc sp. 'Peltigera malacea cyanobiont' DB3992 TaxID=1206980 RepID=UPI00211E7E50|nr:hypothetical protein [Nostoc sp. 'Peltigera malacea cyanobiont' DB3992]
MFVEIYESDACGGLFGVAPLYLSAVRQSLKYLNTTSEYLNTTFGVPQHDFQVPQHDFQVPQLRL